MNEEVYISKIEALADLSKHKYQLPECVYHYTAKENVGLIFLSNALSYKLTESSKFDDKLEGECVTAFYDVALEELVEEGVITEDDRQALEKLEGKTQLFYYKNSAGNTEMSKTNSVTTYIGCFSELECDRNMIEGYIKNEGHVGVCIRMNSRHIEDYISRTYRYGCRVFLLPVMYGRDVIRHFKSFISEVINISGGTESEFFKKEGFEFIRKELSFLRFIAKSGKYRHEKEYRIILQVPRKLPKDWKGQVFNKVDNGGLVELPASCAFGIIPINMESDEVRCLLRERNYPDNLVNLMVGTD